MTGNAKNPMNSEKSESAQNLKSQEEIQEYFTTVLQDAKEREERRLGPQDDGDDDNFDESKDDDDTVSSKASHGEKTRSNDETQSPYSADSKQGWLLFDCFVSSDASLGLGGDPERDCGPEEPT